MQSHGQSQGLGPSHVPILPGASNGQMLSTNRLMDLLDAVKIEFDSLVNEINIRKNHQEDIDFKIQAQVNEMVTMQKYIHDLERSHIRTRAA